MPEDSRSEVLALSATEGEKLLRIARDGLVALVGRNEVYEPALVGLPPALQRPGASFVTLRNGPQLRGCLGSTEYRQPLALDVARNAAAAARDPRLPAVTPAELAEIRLEVTVLTPLQPLPYANYDELLATLRPGVDGVLLVWQAQRGLYLPQMWSRLPDPNRFLHSLCHKAAIPAPELTRLPPAVAVSIFQIRAFHEEGYVEL